jgi:hypothetical protein
LLVFLILFSLARTIPIAIAPSHLFDQVFMKTLW